VLVLEADEIGADGEVSGGEAGVPAVRALAVLELEGAGRVVERCRGPVMARVARAYTDLCVLDVTDEGLVVVELAPGVSAADVQRRCEAMLHVSPTVGPMVLASETQRGLD
jgi:acyl CoA:acetate/3-ketoacid CoA transferase beta subunit